MEFSRHVALRFIYFNTFKVAGNLLNQGPLKIILQAWFRGYKQQGELSVTSIITIIVIKVVQYH